ncbi:MAG: DNA mismatch repair protein [Microbacterium sp. SCN 70-200]|uniref:DNA mismatch repair protein n=1 Tax=unclassified Microbacterium TaxID=2609290 RepID=UPI000868BF26|nr:MULTISPECIES: DNA mismatch repair protein [unclassified Microbacterium]MBN9214553.1 DNA mismatch repair protein [Microbacterium sp.]ODT41447.1 MAG: DNA mismatch repair protein [Microbacterium sp. SCN 70-200]OJV84073.1 MAG: DNA mismatch repair protein [Microbacterium sp. 70-16]
MTLIDGFTTPTVRGVTLRAVSARRWRVLDRTGRILGHLRAEAVSAGTRFHAERFDLAGRRLRELGAFWTAVEAVECLRYLR